MKRILLVGGGHAHAVVLRHLAKTPLRGARVALVTPNEREIYTGMLPGVLAGHYALEDAQVNFAALAARAGAELFKGAVAGLDLPSHGVSLADGRELEYDLASIDVGAIASAAIPGAREHAVPVKPFPVFLQAWHDLQPRHVAFVGGGAAGVELAMAARRHGCEATVYSERSPFPAPLERRVGAALRRLGVSRIGLAVDSIEPGPVIRAGGSEARYDAVVLTTGASPWPWLRGAGLALDERGFLLVDDALRSVSHPEVFAAGDCATLRDAPHPKAGVYAVRHGQALARNLQRAVAGEPLEPYRPQRRALLLMSCGGRHAIGSWGRLAFEGGWAWRWKDRIDRRWIARLRG